MNDTNKFYEPNYSNNVSFNSNSVQVRDKAKAHERVRKFFSRENVFKQLKTQVSYLVPHRSDVKLVLNIGGGSYTDNEKVVVGLPEMFIEKSYEEIYIALRALVGHECQHVNSSNFPAFSGFIKDVGTYLYDKHGIGKHSGQSIGKHWANSVEDGRIEKILGNKLPGYVRHLKFLNGTIREAQPVKGNSELGDFLYTITMLSVTGLYPKGYGDLYKGTDLNHNISKIKDDIIDGINAVTCQQGLNVCWEMIYKVEDYLVALLKQQAQEDQDFINSIPQQMEFSDSDEVDTNSSRSISVHFKPEKKKKDKKQKEEEEQEGSGSGSGEEEEESTDDKKHKSSGKQKSDNQEDQSKDGDRDSEESEGSSGKSDETDDEDGEDKDSTSGNASSSDEDEENSESSGNGKSYDGDNDEAGDDEDGDDQSKSSGGDGSDEDSEEEDDGDSNSNSSDSSSNDDDGDSDSDSSDSSDKSDSSSSKDKSSKDNSNQDNSDSSQSDTNNAQSDGDNSDDEEDDFDEEDKLVEDELNLMEEDLIKEAQSKLDRETPKSKKDKEENKDKLTPEDLKEIEEQYKNQGVKKFKEIKGFPINNSLPDNLKRDGRKLKREFEKILKNKQALNLKGQKRGILDTDSLYRVGLKDYNVFEVRGTPHTSDFVAFLLQDGSGSMSSDYKQLYSAQAVAMLEEGMKGVIPFKSATFAVDGWGGAVSHYVIKDFDENGSENYAWNFNNHRRASGGNKDGYSIRVATRELLKRPEKDRILVVLSDGLPSDYNGGSSEGMLDVKNAVKEARKKGIFVLSVIFGTQEFRDAYIENYKFMYENNIISCAPENITSQLIKNFKTLITKR